jgi:hypothetical protein
MSPARPQRPQRPSRLARLEPMPEERCYLCDGMVKRNDQVVRVHEATMHRRCYEEDIRRGRY